MEIKKNPTNHTAPSKIKATIAIASGKGGVGKSTITANLALALAEKNIKIGLLDADIYGPNIPLILGIENEKLTIENFKLIPIKKYNLKIISVSFITEQNKALIWRGPLANKLIEQFLNDVNWGELDLLIIDLPPGTGDVPLSIIQKANLKGGIVITTPHEVSLADVKKMINMFETTKTKIFGIVENMSHLYCPDCHHKIELFPNSVDRSISKTLKHNLLAEFPFEPQIGMRNKDGLPAYFSNVNETTVKEYRKLAEKILKLIK